MVSHVLMLGRFKVVNYPSHWPPFAGSPTPRFLTNVTTSQMTSLTMPLFLGIWKLHSAHTRLHHRDEKVIGYSVIGTEGALRLPTTHDNHPSIPTQSHPHTAVKTTSLLKI